ncbi:hypothetical protein PGTUg99_000367 [Puccinia graminis f. sp. tritici]|uniref:Uncharacterized protein n=1 Tax=Puccinia graminis f. sp. tritici TaxID=56615 RepID=A0A5B0QDL6_PUCGR|nr:hypothetical protein PGTUg99_011708 [Puccinia graminis f. sp. tritici]KAA1111219.1 hypothetical protein PGTUg99_000367 [Puccinia graminis f. sp. tritici]
MNTWSHPARFLPLPKYIRSGNVQERRSGFADGEKDDANTMLRVPPPTWGYAEESSPALKLEEYAGGGQKISAMSSTGVESGTGKRTGLHVPTCRTPHGLRQCWQSHKKLNAQTLENSRHISKGGDEMAPAGSMGYKCLAKQAVKSYLAP